MKRLALLVLLCACGDNLGPGPILLSDFGREAMVALCDWGVRCRHVPDHATCMTLVDEREYDVRRARDGVIARRLEYDAEEATRCLEDARAVACSEWPFDAPSCGRVFIGRVVEGQACTTNFDCVGDGDCLGAVCAGQCCLGTCGPPNPPTEPQVLAKVGEECASHLDCVPTAYCELDGRCTPLPDEPGERCLYGCASGDLYCDVDDEICRAYARLGDSCGETVLCDEAWAYCDQVCKLRPNLGEPCDPARRCVGSSYCVGGVCAPPDEAGAACSADSTCKVACDEATGQCLEYEKCGP